jgi:type I restriction enzyme R subunit
MNVLYKNLLPEQLARKKIDNQLKEAGWNVVSRDEYIRNHPQAVREAIMAGSMESDYLLFIDNKAIAVIEAKQEENPLGEDVAIQAENYAVSFSDMYGLWFEGIVPLVYLANGKKIYFKNMLNSDSEYIELTEMHSPKKMLQIIKKSSEYGALPRLDNKGLRDCQYNAQIEFENSLRNGRKKSLAILATGAGKTYLACLASYRLLNCTPVNRVLFLADRNNLARQAEGEFSRFNRTENGMALNSLYDIQRLKKNEDINASIVISTIQKLFSVLTGNKLIDSDDGDEEDDFFKEETEEQTVVLGDNIMLKPDHFKFIVIDECHRSIYGKWRAVLDYFKDAIVLGLTATPTAEAYAFFDNNIAETYTYEDSIIDGVNVPFRVYDIETRRTLQGGEIEANVNITELIKKTGEEGIITISQTVFYPNEDLDKTVIDRNQIKAVLTAYRDSIYTDLYPEREEQWDCIPKTLIFAKNDKHADEIVDAIHEVFKEKFYGGRVPTGFAQKITYSAGDSNQLIDNFRFNKEFRIAVTVTLVATGTDIKPLEVVMFMSDVKSDILYTQMKGRGCRTINIDKLKEVTSNAKYKECFYIVDAVGVTKSEKNIPRVRPNTSKKLSLKDVLERISHGEISNENLALLRDYCSTITNRYIDNPLFRKHLDEFINNFDYSPILIAATIKKALDSNSLPPYKSPSEQNVERFNLIAKLIDNNAARDKLLELQKGYIVFAPDGPDELIYKGFSIETVRKFIDNFEKYLDEHKDSIEALRIIYNSESKLITHSMLCELRDKLLAADRQYIPYVIWENYKRLDTDGKVYELDRKRNLNALTNLIQIARYAYRKNEELFSLFGVGAQRFNLYVGNVNHSLSNIQIDVMKQIAEYIVGEGAINAIELNKTDTDLWRRGINAFVKAEILAEEMQLLSKYIIGVV